MPFLTPFFPTAVYQNRMGRLVRNLLLSAAFLMSTIGSPMALSTALVTQNIEFRVVDDQDPKWSGIVSVLSPDNDAVLLQDKVAIKGTNRWLSPVILNGRVIPIRSDGRFSTTIPVQPGVNVLYLGVVSPDGKSTIVIKRQVTRLVRSKVSTSDPTLTDLFYGFDLIPNASKRDPKSFVTRGDLAVFLDRLSGLAPNLPSGNNPLGTVDIDPRSPLLGPITRSVRDGLFDLYADGSFRAEAPVSRLDYTVALVRRLGLPVDEPDPPKDARWYAKFFRAAVRGGLITTAETTTTSVGITIDDLATWSARIPDIRRVYQDLGFADADPDDQLFRQAVNGMLGVKRERGLIPSVDIDSGYVDMSGHWLSQTVLKLNNVGRFSTEMAGVTNNASPRFYPKATMSRLLLARWMVGVYQIPDGRPDGVVVDLPEDRAGGSQMATLVAAGILTPDKRGRVFPDRPVSRVELVTMLLRVNGLVPTVSVGHADSPYKDVPKTSWAVPYLNLAIQTGLLNAGGDFGPNRLVTRAEVMALMAKTPAIQSVLKGVSND